MAAEFDGFKIAQERIAREARERTGKLDLAGLDLEEIPKEVAGLTHLRELDLGRRWDEDGFHRNARLASLAPLAGLVALKSLNCRSTQVADLAPLEGLVALQSLDCSQTQVADLAPLQGLVALQSLDCSQTQVADLAPLQGLVALQSLDCSQTQVADLAPLEGLVALKSLNCSGTQVADLAPLQGLVALQSLSCSDTQVADLAPLEGLVALQSLDCSDTQVADLAPLVGLPKLATVDADDCPLTTLPRALIEAPTLESLFLRNARDPDIPSGVLSSTRNENCLPALCAYFADSGPEDVRLHDVKLMVLGNGRVGKTQLCNRLLHGRYDPNSRSTHGVTVEHYPLPHGDGTGTIPLHVWDFGGQDIYHGTHALFLRDHAIFALVWARDFEAPSDDPGDERFGNRPLRYWADYVKHASGGDRAVVAVQTRCDSARDEAPLPVPEAEMRESFAHFTRVEVSAAKPRGIEHFREKLAEAAEYALDQEGKPKIPAAWARVKAALEALREQRRQRTLTTDEFATLCLEQGVKSEPKHLLQYLHRTGIVFHRPDLMDRIVLDQAWALEAIYAVFDRDSGAWRRLRRQRGRFTPSDLAVTAWADRRQSERALFLDMMRSCGVCFELWRPYDGEPELIAPEALPERDEIDDSLRSIWDTEQPTREQTYRYAFLHDGLIRALIASVGQSARGNGAYWRDGVCAFETKTGARARIEQRRTADSGGEIVVRTRGGRAEELLATLCKRLERTQQRLGLAGEPLSEIVAAPMAKPAQTNFGRDATPRCNVSYAWKDEANPNREADVDRLCEEADKRRWEVRRDKQALSRGDSISDFMRAIGKGDRVFVFLSEKYLRSPFCMFELFEVWNFSRRDDDDFWRRVRLFVLDDAKIWTPKQRLKHAEYWFDEFQETEKFLKEKTTVLLGDNDNEAHRRTAEFYLHVGHVLERLADRVQSRNFDAFLQWGFDEPER